MKTILVALDRSILAEQVLPYVRILEPIMQTRIDLLRAVADIEPDSMLAQSIAAAYGVGDEHPAQGVVERVCQAVELDDLAEELQCFPGCP